jgi:hypothetical protein
MSRNGARRDAVAALEDIVHAAFGPDARIDHHINWGDSHRRMLAYNRRHERAYRRSRRNQPPRSPR